MMFLAERLRSNEFQWTAAAALSVIFVSAIPAVCPSWFVYPSGQITVLGGVGQASLLALGLLAGWRWVRYVALALLAFVAAPSTLAALTGFAPEFQLGFALLAVAAWLAIGLLGFAQPVRSYFGYAAAEEEAA